MNFDILAYGFLALFAIGIACLVFSFVTKRESISNLSLFFAFVFLTFATLIASIEAAQYSIPVLTTCLLTLICVVTLSFSGFTPAAKAIKTLHDDHVYQTRLRRQKRSEDRAKDHFE